MDGGKRHAPLDEVRMGRAAREISDAVGDKTQGEKRSDRRGCDHRRDRLLRAGQDGKRDQRRSGERRAGKIACARPALAFLDQVADQRGHGQIVRSSERRDREGERRQQAVHQPEADEARAKSRARAGSATESANSQLTAKGIAEPSAAPRSAPISATIMNSTSASVTTLRSGRADRLENRQRRAFSLDETLRRVRDADPANDQRQQSRQRQELGEAIDIATEVRRNS